MPRIRVDFTGINRPYQNQYLVLINFTIDVQYLQTHQSAVYCSQLIQNYLLEQFQQEVMIGVQICASYLLSHTETNQQRTFTGSFNNTSNMSNVLSGDQFFPFRIANWQQQFLGYCELERASNILNHSTEVNTKWQFDSLLTIIVNCQLLLPTHHPFIQTHGLNVAQNGHRRRQITLFLS